MIAIQPVPGRPIVVLLSGLPGSGKSHFARRLAARARTVHIQTDAIRRDLFAVRTYSDDEHQFVYEAALAALERTVGAGDHAIVDATMLHDAARTPIVEVARHAGAGLAIVHFEITPEETARRLANRTQLADTTEQSEAGMAVYEMLRPIYQRSQLPHWLITSAAGADSVLDALARLLNTPSPDGPSH